MVLPRRGIKLLLITCRLHHCLHFLFLIILGAVIEVMLLKGQGKQCLVQTTGSLLFAHAQLEIMKASVLLEKQTLETTDDIFFSDLCERSLRSIKARQGSIVIPLGSLQFGVCRHRALLMKYLCDRMDPPVPCELVRGYLDFTPHAWNVILSRRGDSVVRMVVDACRPHDIREETDLEYFSRSVLISKG
ncbi:hypothetical protein OIU78_004594 [Salix suchowensis]|nr:hypothetical protein OIU78_004594 [Salix suchowensis]